MMAMKKVVSGVVAFAKRRNAFPSIFGPPELRPDRMQMTRRAADPMPTDAHADVQRRRR